MSSLTRAFALTRINGHSWRRCHGYQCNAASEIVADAELRGRVLGVRMPVEDEDADKPWRMAPSRRPKTGPIGAPLPSKITIVVADQLYIDRTDLPPAMTARLIRLAAFQNPEFYRAQSMRFPTFGKPRIISCAELHVRHVALPRGLPRRCRCAVPRSRASKLRWMIYGVTGNPLPARGAVPGHSARATGQGIGRPRSA